MLRITVPEGEFYNEKLNEFINIKKTELQLEHSLVSISKWEQKWHRAFLSNGPKTEEELRDYIRCMTLTQNVNPMTYLCINEQNVNEIMDYIKDPMTATTFSNENNKKSREIITSEIIYYWMTKLNIPVEFQKWHINRLLTLIRVCQIKEAPPKKMSKAETLKRNSSLNTARRMARNSKG